MKIGFLVIDLQPVHLKGVDKQAVERACEYINYVADMLRSKNHVIVHIQDIEGMDESNKESFRTIPEISVAEHDLIVTKEYSNSFWKTDLEQILKDKGVELLIIAGNAAEHCVLFTYNGAGERGFKPVILQNGILSTYADAITSMCRDRNLVSHTVIQYLI